MDISPAAAGDTELSAVGFQLRQVRAFDFELSWLQQRQDLLLVLLWSLVLRAIFALLTANTYDPDEFVVLSLSRDLAHGATPYNDFMFFHPPGILVLFRVLGPLTDWWWPTSRIVMLLADTLTAGLVWRLGSLLYGRREALAAGFLYGASPLALICGVRVGQDPIVTALGVGGLTLLLSRHSVRGAVLPGVMLGLAVWIKYPALLFLPVYVLAAPRRAVVTISAAAATVAVVFAPFVLEVRNLYDQTVVWQLAHRRAMSADERIGSVAAFWLLVNPLSLPAFVRGRQPAWLLCGFGVGGVFLLASQVYYHYFVPVVPFAALLAAPLVARLARRAAARVAAATLMLVVAWAIDIDFGSEASRLFITASRLSAIEGTVQLIQRTTGPGERVLTDQFEYAYLAHRPSVKDYFWNMSNVVDAYWLERHLHTAGAVVLTRGVTAPYPTGLTRYLQHSGYDRIQTRTTVIWLLSRREVGVNSGNHASTETFCQTRKAACGWDASALTVSGKG